MRLSSVLLKLSELIYDVDDGYVGSTVGLELPIAGRPDDRASVIAKLIHFRYGHFRKKLVKQYLMSALRGIFATYDDNVSVH